MDKLNLYQKLLKVQSELVAPKSQYNSFAKYNYRSCEDILEAVKPLLNQSGLTLKIEDDLVLVGDRYYVKSTATVIDVETNDRESASAFAREELTKKGADASQITGSSSSYARKYALNGLFCIDDTKDADSTNKHGKEDKKESKGNNLTEPQLKRLYALGYKVGYDFTTVKQHIMTKFKVEPSSMTKEQYDTMCNGYEELKK